VSGWESEQCKLKNEKCKMQNEKLAMQKGMGKWGHDYR